MGEPGWPHGDEARSLEGPKRQIAEGSAEFTHFYNPLGGFWGDFRTPRRGWCSVVGPWLVFHAA